MAAAGIGIIGGAHNGFGASLAGIGISVLKDKVEVWKNVDGKVDVLAQSAITVSATAQVRMTVKDGYWLCFEFRKGQRWIPLATEVMLRRMFRGEWASRIGLCAKGETEPLLISVRLN